MDRCFFCSLPVEPVSRSASFVNVLCFRCGSYRLSTLVEHIIEVDQLTREQVANISGYIRENQGLSILEKDFAELQMLRTPTVAEKAMKGLLAIATQYP